MLSGTTSGEGQEESEVLFEDDYTKEEINEESEEVESEEGGEDIQRSQIFEIFNKLFTARVGVGQEEDGKKDLSGESTEIEESKEDVKEVDGAPEATLDSEKEGGVYRKTVQKGEGLTHVARRAVNDYINENDLNLSAEQRIYMEDYIQKGISPENSAEREGRWLEVGEVVEVSEDIIEEALEEALQLTPQEIENLHQYTPFVYFSS